MDEASNIPGLAHSDTPAHNLTVKVVFESRWQMRKAPPFHAPVLSPFSSSSPLEVACPAFGWGDVDSPLLTPVNSGFSFGDCPLAVF